MFKRFCSETGMAISQADAQIVCDWIMLTAEHHRGATQVVGPHRLFCSVGVAWFHAWGSLPLSLTAALVRPQSRTHERALLL